MLLASSVRKGKLVQTTTETHDAAATTDWVMDAFGWALDLGETRLIPYLMDLSEDLAFESGMEDRREDVKQTA